MSQDAVHDRQKAASSPIEPTHPHLSAFRYLLQIIVEFGIPTVAFGTGIYAFILALHVDVVPELKIGVALVLTMLGFAGQLWMFARHNPRPQSDEVKDQLSRMTKLVERLVENSIQRNSPPPPAGPG